MSSSECKITPLRNQIIFDFVETTHNGKFNTKTAGGLLVVESSDKQVDYCRWGTILATGPDVEDFSVGDIVLIDKLRWTNEFALIDSDDGYWITTDEDILATWDDPESLPSS